MTPFRFALMLAPLFWAHPDAASAGGTAPQPVAEIVTFRLLDGADDTTFTQAAAAMAPFLAQTNAVLSRHLSKTEDGTWTDHITWTSLGAAKTAAAAMKAEPAAAPFMSMIDPSSIRMHHAPILVSMD